ncbi:DUF4083 domain-containing protein [Bacillus sp. PS06]|uniref:DUF4083 domain-containing protein n=1 Tax=Bacillus sp. PS06 TaxID=2764176 RepID=UPI00177E4BC5|nr:DUF4083 domain-containing protein [Bacillus sp. PS06]MBD8067385.1 DUF4083 domain-containing protein [Bacillus sp. PS06]
MNLLSLVGPVLLFLVTLLIFTSITLFAKLLLKNQQERNERLKKIEEKLEKLIESKKGL